MKKILLLLTSMVFAASVNAKNLEILNVSYDPTREFYEEYNKDFVSYWKNKTGDDVKIKQSHGGSGKQARSVIDGLKADVVTLALAYDIDAISEKTNLLPKDWQSKLPNNSTPYSSTIVFLVKKGNPKKIKDWDDLAKTGVSVITPNPKTSGGARWNFLAAYSYGLKKFGSDEKAQEFVKSIFKNVPILDTGARGSTITFAQRNIGDVLIAWESEALMSLDKFNNGQFEIVTPSVSILAEPPVALVEKNASKNGTSEVSKAYLEYLYTPKSQELLAKHHYRPSDKAVLEKYKAKFPKLDLVTIKDFGGWKNAQKKYFDDGGIFDTIYSKK